MKKILFSCIALLTFAFQIEINAQQVIDVSGGNVTKSYSTSATGGSTISQYNWSVSSGAVSFTNGGAATQSITWDHTAIGTHTITMIPRSNNGCDGASRTLSVQLVNGLPLTVTFTDAALEVCPMVAVTNPGGGDVAAQINLAGSALGASDTWTVYYTIDGGAETSQTITGVTNANFVQNTSWANASATTNASHTISVTRFVVSGSEYTPSSSINLSVAVYPTPTADVISY